MVKKENPDELGIEAIFDSANYGKVACKIKIRDGFALAVFSDRRLARDMYYAEKKLGIDDVQYKERLSALATRYTDKTKEEIITILVNKLREHNVQVIKNKGGEK